MIEVALNLDSRGEEQTQYMLDKEEPQERLQGRKWVIFVGIR